MNGVHAALGSPTPRIGRHNNIVGSGIAGKKPCVSAPGGRCHHVLLTCRAHALTAFGRPMLAGMRAHGLIRWMMAKGYIATTNIRFWPKADIRPRLRVSDSVFPV